VRWLIVTVVLIDWGCGTQHAGAGSTVREPQADLLREFGFVSCLVAGGVQNDATDVAQSFYLESIDGFPERFEAITQCANVYLRSRHNTLNRNLAIPYCLDFMHSPQLTTAMTVKDGKGVDCGTNQPPPPRSASSIPELGMALPCPRDELGSRPPKDCSDSNLASLLARSGVKLLKPVQYMDKWRLDASGVMSVPNVTVKRALGFSP
jgi:hypothetical protein